MRLQSDSAWPAISTAQSITCSHAHCKSGNISERVQYRHVLVTISLTGKKWYMAYRILAFRMSLSGLQGRRSYSLQASRPCDSSASCSFYLSAVSVYTFCGLRPHANNKWTNENVALPDAIGLNNRTNWCNTRTDLPNADSLQQLHCGISSCQSLKHRYAQSIWEETRVWYAYIDDITELWPT